MNSLGYTIVTSIDEDLSRAHAFVYNSFLKSLQKTPPYCMIPNKQYFSRFHDLVENWLSNGTLALAVTDVDGEESILGWSLKCGEMLCYVYVKQRVRGFGIGTDLVGKLHRASSIRNFCVATDAGLRFLEHYYDTLSHKMTRLQYSTPKGVSNDAKRTGQTVERSPEEDNKEAASGNAVVVSQAATVQADVSPITGF